MNNKSFNKVSGNQAEIMAIEYLKKKGYKILSVNFKNNIGEIDIIAKDRDVIVFVEVKFRKNDYFGLPREAVTNQKQFKIRKVALGYLKSYHKLDSPCRFDVIDILGDEITHIEDCF